jgi:hypothetical protein
MRVDALFDIRYGNSLELNRLTRAESPDGVSFVGRAMTNNGVTARVLPPADSVPGRPGELTVALSGNGVLSTFVQPEPFLTGYHVSILTPKNPGMSLAEKLWWALCIKENRYRYSWGRQANRTLASLELPDDAPGWLAAAVVPDLKAMGTPAGPRVDLPPREEWGTWTLGELFDIKRGRYVPAVQKKPGLTLVVSSSSVRNGAQGRIALAAEHAAGSITVARNGSVGQAFYQNEPFFATDDAHVFTYRDGPLDPELGHFLCTVIRLEKFRYSYGRKWSLEKMRSTVIHLPSTPDGRPDADTMRNYIRGLAFSSSIRPATASVSVGG